MRGEEGRGGKRVGRQAGRKAGNGVHIQVRVTNTAVSPHDTYMRGSVAISTLIIIHPPEDSKPVYIYMYIDLKRRS